MEILPKLFGSKEKAKLMRLFLFNSNLFFSLADVTKRTKISIGAAKREINLLEEIGFIVVKKLANVPTDNKKSKKKKSPAKNNVWQLNPDFFFVEHLRSIFNADFLAGREDLADRFKNCGKVKMVVLSGLFVQDGGTRADILVVGDDLRRVTIENIVSVIESEIGREIKYAVLDTRDYLFRLTSSDHFVRDILDFPHKCLIDRLGS
ncbi:MAG TPA: hypothetical protein P5274_03055 [Candidatus Paceibacterota bacterium]|nr:hypothetical protein [Candidatus Paceibacterota bacterium]